MKSLESISKFFNSESIAVVGVSRNDKKFGSNIYKELKQKGFNVYPVNPNINSIQGDICYPDLKSLPVKPDSVLILTNKSQTAQIVKDAIETGTKNIWIQQTADTPEAIKSAKENNINLIYKECILMFLEPVKGAHAFHRFINKLFGKYPK